MGGLEAVKELRKLNPHLAAIASSGYADDPILANYREYGFRHALAKPYTISALLSAIDQSIHEKSV
jgi:CheY-like chemotaxis protein